MFGKPGYTAPQSTEPRTVVWPSGEPVVRTSRLLAGETVDRGSHVATHLRPGLLLGEVTATEELRQYDPDAVDGTEVLFGVLEHELVLSEEPGGDGVDRYAPIIRRGPVDPRFLLVDGDPLIGHASAAGIRSAMKDAGFTFRDES